MICSSVWFRFDLAKTILRLVLERMDGVYESVLFLSYVISTVIY